MLGACGTCCACALWLAQNSNTVADARSEKRWVFFIASSSDCRLQVACRGTGPTAVLHICSVLQGRHCGCSTPLMMLLKLLCGPQICFPRHGGRFIFRRNGVPLLLPPTP